MAEGEEAHQGCGLSYELYNQRFQSSVDALLERLPNSERDNVIALATKHGYEHEQPNDAPISASDWGMTSNTALTALILIAVQQGVVDEYHDKQRGQHERNTTIKIRGGYI